MGTDDKGFFDTAVPGDERDPPRVGHNSDGEIVEMVTEYIRQAEDLMAQREDLTDRLKVLWKEAKGKGLDDKALRFIIKERSQDRDVLEEFYKLVERYRFIMDQGTAG